MNGTAALTAGRVAELSSASRRSSPLRDLVRARALLAGEVGTL